VSFVGARAARFRSLRSHFVALQVQE